MARSEQINTRVIKNATTSLKRISSPEADGGYRQIGGPCRRANLSTSVIEVISRAFHDGHRRRARKKGAGELEPAAGVIAWEKA